MSVTTYTSCLRIERTDGFVICLTELDKDLIINDNVLGLPAVNQDYISAAGYTPTNMQSTSDNAVNNADVEGVLTSIGVQREDIIGGRYDFAKLHIFIWDWKNNVLIKKLGSGHWGETTIKDGSYVAEFRSLAQQLQQNIGRTYNPECDEQLGGPRCGIALGDSPKTNGFVTADTSDIHFKDVALIEADHYWTGSSLEWTSGVNIGITSTVDAFSNTQIDLEVALPNIIDKYDTYILTKPEVQGSTITEVGSNYRFTDASRIEPDGFFNGDDITFTTGNNIGTYTIQAFSLDEFIIDPPASDLFMDTDLFTIDKLFSGTVTDLIDQTNFKDTGNILTDGYYDGLTLTWETGANVGMTAIVTAYVSQTFTVDTSFTISLSDTFSISNSYTGSITSTLFNLQFKDSSLVEADNYFNGKTVSFISGNNVGTEYPILTYINNIITLQTSTTNPIGLNQYNIDTMYSGSSNSSGASKVYIEDSGVSAIAEYPGMYLEFDSGLNEGEFRAVTGYGLGYIEVTTPFDNNILYGDTYTIINAEGDTYMSLGTVTSVSNNQTFYASLTDNAAFGDGYFNYGKLIFKSGLNDEIFMEVKKFTDSNNRIKLFLPMPFQIEVGDVFQIFAGCDKRLTTCKTKFNNHINFQGFPYIPGQDQISKFGGQ